MASGQVDSPAPLHSLNNCESLKLNKEIKNNNNKTHYITKSVFHVDLPLFKTASYSNIEQMFINNKCTKLKQDIRMEATAAYF